MDWLLHFYSFVYLFTGIGIILVKGLHALFQSIIYHILKVICFMLFVVFNHDIFWYLGNPINDRVQFLRSSENLWSPEKGFTSCENKIGFGKSNSSLSLHPDISPTSPWIGYDGDCYSFLGWSDADKYNGLKNNFLCSMSVVKSCQFLSKTFSRSDLGIPGELELNQVEGPLVHTCRSWNWVTIKLEY